MWTTPAQPRRRPRSSCPSRSARTLTARMAGFRPGTSPPPVRIAMRFLPLFTFATDASPRQRQRPRRRSALGRTVEKEILALFGHEELTILVSVVVPDDHHLRG